MQKDILLNTEHIICCAPLHWSASVRDQLLLLHSHLSEKSYNHSPQIKMSELLMVYSRSALRSPIYTLYQRLIFNSIFSNILPLFRCNLVPNCRIMLSYPYKTQQTKTAQLSVVYPHSTAKHLPESWLSGPWECGNTPVHTASHRSNTPGRGTWHTENTFIKLKIIINNNYSSLLWLTSW